MCLLMAFSYGSIHAQDSSDVNPSKQDPFMFSIAFDHTKIERVSGFVSGFNIGATIDEKYPLSFAMRFSNYLNDVIEDRTGQAFGHPIDSRFTYAGLSFGIVEKYENSKVFLNGNITIGPGLLHNTNYDYINAIPFFVIQPEIIVYSKLTKILHIGVGSNYRYAIQFRDDSDQKVDINNFSIGIHVTLRK